MSRYQQRKARALAAVLMLAAVQSNTSYYEAGLLAARMTQENWRTVSFAADVAMADTVAQKFAVAYLLSVGQEQL